MNELPYVFENGKIHQLSEDEYDAHLKSFDNNVVLAPHLVSMRQFRLALIETKKVTLFNDAIKNISDSKEKAKIQIEWDYNATVDKNAPWFLFLLDQLNLTNEQVDDIFIKASST